MVIYGGTGLVLKNCETRKNVWKRSILSIQDDIDKCIKLVQRKFTTDRYVVYKWLGCKFSPSSKGEGLFSIFPQREWTNEENRILYYTSVH